MVEKHTNTRVELTDPLNTFLFEQGEGIKCKETVVFCGAGISRNSGLPIVTELVSYVLKKLGVTQEETKTIMNSGLPFEAFIEEIRENSDPNKIFDIFDLGEPNTNHFLLAKLAKIGYVTTICTTNFDRLIEKAFEIEGLARGEDYRVFYKENELDCIDWQEDKIRLIKIHGSVEDKENMAITLGQVASQVLSSRRKYVIEHLFSTGMHKNVLVLGYSCSDVFDISPHIETIRANHKRVVFVDHHKNKRVVKDLADKEQKNPFHRFKESKWVISDTDELINSIWDFCLPKEEYLVPELDIDGTVWQQYVNEWYLEAKEKCAGEVKYSMVGQILYAISEFESALNYYLQAVEIAREIGDRKNECVFLGNLGNLFIDLGEYEKAIIYYEQALGIAREIGERKLEGNWLGGLAVANYELGEYEKAISYNEQALGIAREIGERKLEGNWLGGLASVDYRLGNYQKAIIYYKQALDIAREFGDKRKEGHFLGNLGTIYGNLGEYEKAISYYEQALGIAREIGDKVNVGMFLGNLGNPFSCLGDFQKAISYYEQALGIAREIGSRKLEGNWLGGLANAAWNLGNYQKARSDFEQALGIAKEIGDKQSEGNWLGGLANTLGELGEYEKAIIYFEQALGIAKEIALTT